MGVSKVEFGGKTLVDLTGDTVNPQSLLKGETAHGADGEPVEGAMVAVPTTTSLAVTQEGVSALDGTVGKMLNDKISELDVGFGTVINGTIYQNVNTKNGKSSDLAYIILPDGYWLVYAIVFLTGNSDSGIGSNVDFYLTGNIIPASATLSNCATYQWDRDTAISFQHGPSTLYVRCIPYFQTIQGYIKVERLVAFKLR